MNQAGLVALVSGRLKYEPIKEWTDIEQHAISGPRLSENTYLPVFFVKLSGHVTGRAAPRSVPSVKTERRCTVGGPGRAIFLSVLALDGSLKGIVGERRPFPCRAGNIRFLSKPAKIGHR